MQNVRPPRDGDTTPLCALSTEPDRPSGSDDPSAPRLVSSIALLALTHAGAAAIGGMIAFRVTRPQRRRSSIELAVDGAKRQSRGRHRR
ncbi:hypothetical protein [Pseudonocardia cypriaca]|uniref:hypothetical protein n=1 Tax=Pseudonocardia cypriaca TaxID=882449 RepID=UPI001151C738|nr:hypothetical protein [Pseudonocardia cypriaca]